MPKRFVEDAKGNAVLSGELAQVSAVAHPEIECVVVRLVPTEGPESAKVEDRVFVGERQSAESRRRAEMKRR